MDYDKGNAGYVNWIIIILVMVQKECGGGV